MKKIIAVFMAISLSLSFVCIPVCAADDNGMISAVVTDERAQRQAVRAAAAAIIGESPSDSITVSNNFVNDILDNVGENPTPENISDEVSKYACIFKNKTDEYAKVIADDAEY